MWQVLMHMYDNMNDNSCRSWMVLEEAAPAPPTPCALFAWLVTCTKAPGVVLLATFSCRCVVCVGQGVGVAQRMA